jgi:hypothetical protein
MGSTSILSDVKVKSGLAQMLKASRETLIEIVLV